MQQEDHSHPQRAGVGEVSLAMQCIEIFCSQQGAHLIGLLLYQMTRLNNFSSPEIANWALLEFSTALGKPELFSPVGYYQKFLSLFQCWLGCRALLPMLFSPEKLCRAHQGQNFNFSAVGSQQQQTSPTPQCWETSIFSTTATNLLSSTPQLSASFPCIEPITKFSPAKVFSS